MKKKMSLKKVLHNLLYVLKLMFNLRKSYLYLILILSILMTFIPFITLILSQKLLNELQYSNNDIKQVVYILCTYIFIQLVSTISNVLQSYYMGKYEEYVKRELRNYYDKLCAKLSLKDFENDKIYDMIQRAEYEMGSRPILIFNNFIKLLKGLIGISLSIIILVHWHIWILLGFITLPLVCFNYFKKVSELEYKTLYERTSLQRKSWYLTYLMTKDYYIKEVRTLRLTDYFLNEIYNIREVLYYQNIGILKKKNILKIQYQFINFIFLSIIIFTALFETFYKRILIGNFMTYINTSTKVSTYVSSIVDSLFALYSDSLYCENVITFIEYIEKKQNREKLNLNLKIKDIKKIEFINVSYKYFKSNSYVLKDINLVIEKNDIVAFVGENGSGKTTLIKLILGLYDDYEGKILINGIDLKDIDKNDYINKISSIFQDYNNYEFTIKDNIKFGDITTNLDLNNIESAAKLVMANDFINKLPNKYEQQVGNWFIGGVQLSGGQWQKLALGRGVIRDAKLYIFDEPTASLDPSSEYDFFTNMVNVFKNKIGIFVTHRFINVRIANKIIVFKKGEILESGTHDELMKKKNYYFEMYNLQYNGLKYKNTKNRKDD